MRVVCGRAEEQQPDSYGVAVAKALAPPPVALEWCLPLVRPGGAAILLVGPTADVDAVAGSRRGSAAAEPEVHPGLARGPEARAHARRAFRAAPGVARKRPLA